MANIILKPAWAKAAPQPTDEKHYRSRRQFLREAGFTVAGLSSLGSIACAQRQKYSPEMFEPVERPPLITSEHKTWDNPMAYVADGLEGLYPAERNTAYTVEEREMTPEIVASTNGNFYEFEIASNSPNTAWKNVRDFNQRPWEIKVSGLVDKPATYSLEDIAKIAPMEERLYRFRCVEAWAMTVPWLGFPFKELCKFVGVQDKATHVKFTTFGCGKGVECERKTRAQRLQTWYSWPYYEGLRMDEAMNELSLLAFGIYGHPFPMQLGAPVRMVVPWKYGYKSIKSLVEIEFTSSQPQTFWNDAQPREYGFLSNVEPHVPHPRWSQAKERLLGTGERVPTKLYNGYAEQVAHLYS
jgi:sulfoxide reductase catalytic subunit YedY